jgi:hypothetical protein
VKRSVSVKSLQYRTSADGCAGWRGSSSRRLRGPSDLANLIRIQRDESALAHSPTHRAMCVAMCVALTLRPLRSCALNLEHLADSPHGFGDEAESVRACLHERVSSPCGDDGGAEPAGHPPGGLATVLSSFRPAAWKIFYQL